MPCRLAWALLQVKAGLIKRLKQTLGHKHRAWKVCPPSFSSCSLTEQTPLPFFIFCFPSTHPSAIPRMAAFAGMRGLTAYLSEQDAEGISWYFLLSSLHPHEYLLFPMPGICSSLLKNFKPSPKGHQSLWNLLLTFLVILIFPFIVTPATWYVTHLWTPRHPFLCLIRADLFFPKPWDYKPLRTGTTS